MARRRKSRYYESPWPTYVPVAQRRKAAAREVAKLKRKGQDVHPVVIEGRGIARSVWGKAWCKNLEAYSDYSNRLPRGKTYVRNGSVIDLQIERGRITALVSGTHIYTVEIAIKPLPEKRWKPIRTECSGRVDSLVDLLQGRLDTSVMDVICKPRTGLFPAPREISLSCSCPDWARMCKHVAATLYGVGVRLDDSPQMLFLLRGVDHYELISTTPCIDTTTDAPVLATDDISGLFGIELDDEPRKRNQRTARSVSGKKKPVKAKSGSQARRRRAKHTKGRTREKTRTTAVAPQSVRSIRAGRKIAARDLTSLGISHNKIQYWLRTGVLVHTGTRGVYKATRHTKKALTETLPG
jgi:uncharacterized Zn finger protein